MASNLIHGREGALYLSTASGSTAIGTELGYTNSWSVSMTRDLSEVTPLNNNSKEYVEGLVSGTVSAEGSIRVSDATLRKIYSRFAKTLTSTMSTSPMADSQAAAIVDGNMYLHMIVKPIDTGTTSDDRKGAKFVAPILSNGFSAEASGADIESWSYEGTINGDLLYIESTSTNFLPKKIY